MSDPLNVMQKAPMTKPSAPQSEISDAMLLAMIDDADRMAGGHRFSDHRHAMRRMHQALLEYRALRRASPQMPPRSVLERLVRAAECYRTLFAGPYSSRAAMDAGDEMVDAIDAANDALNASPPRAGLKELATTGAGAMYAKRDPLSPPPSAGADVPYPEFCRQPEKCAGLGCCPLDPTCAD